jgi:glycosyltransferase involved in cell wall biosynthesis
VRRILLVVRWPVGGIRTHLKYFYPLICRALPGLEITCVMPRNDQTGVLERDLASVPIKYVYVEQACTPRMLAVRVNRELATGGFDLLHSHGFTAAASVAMVARFRRVPHLTTVHDVLQATQFTGLQGAVRKSVMKFLLSTVELIHAVSDDVKSNLTSQLGHRFSGRVRVVRNGILTGPILEATPRDLRAGLNLSADALLLGFFGRFMGQKGFRYLVEAVRLHASARVGRPLHVLSFGGGGFVREEQAAIERAGLASSFTFFPFVPDIAGTLKSVDAVIIPSLWEASPLLPMEAMVAGVPVIGTNCIGLSEVLANTPAVVVPAGDGEALADAIAREARDSSRSAAEAFIPVATERFDVTARVPELIQLMTQVSASGRSGTCGAG